MSTSPIKDRAVAAEKGVVVGAQLSHDLSSVLSVPNAQGLLRPENYFCNVPPHSCCYRKGRVGGKVSNFKSLGAIEACL